jgi:predicted nucleotidyltransferase component of viral defense system
MVGQERTRVAGPPAWQPILVESLADNVGAKMNALVQRGAPRDFLDIRELVRRGIASVEQCWDWWSRKNPSIDVRQARAQALRHLEEMEQRRPIDAIGDPRDRSAARRAREWIRRVLLEVPTDPNGGM